MFVYANKDYCRESWDTLTTDWDYKQFLKFYNNMVYLVELESARQEDSQREAEAQRERESAANMVRRR
jgi:hypothetical protein